MSIVFGRGMMANQVGNRCHGRGLGCRGKVIPSPGRQAEGWGSWVAEEDSCHPPAPLVAVNNPAPVTFRLFTLITQAYAWRVRD